MLGLQYSGGNKMKIWPKMKASRSVKGFFKAPKPVKVGVKSVSVKGLEKPKVNVINRAGVGMGKAGMNVGKKLYKFK